MSYYSNDGFWTDTNDYSTDTSYLSQPDNSWIDTWGLGPDALSNYDGNIGTTWDPISNIGLDSDPSNYNLQGILDAITKGAKGVATGTATGLPWLDNISDLWAVKNIVDQYGRNEDWNDLLGRGRDMAGQMQEVINQRDPVQLSALQQMMIAGGNDMYSNASQNLNSINQRLTGNQQRYSPYQLPGAV
jgi:hypothetical protein